MYVAEIDYREFIDVVSENVDLFLNPRIKSWNIIN